MLEIYFTRFIEISIQFLPKGFSLIVNMYIYLMMIWLKSWNNWHKCIVL